MNITSISTIVVVAVLVLGAVSAFIWVSVHRKRQSLEFQTRYGAEYDQTVLRLGSQSKAEADLRKRQARVAKLKIKPLTMEEAARFVDNPSDTVAEADTLVREVMTARGYPMSDFESQAADISVDHPGVVAEYRSAQAIAVRNSRGEADTEELRKAVVHYRTLFSDLLEVRQAPVTERPTPSLVVHS
jgi:hypothetical protein